MTALRRSLYLALITGLALLGAGPGCGGPSVEPPSEPVELTTLEGQPLSLGAPGSKPVLVVFIAINNPLAMSELEKLESLANDYSAKGLELIAIPESSDRPELVSSVFHHQGRLVTVAMDPEGQAAKSFGNVSATPSVRLLSPDGSIVFSSEGAINLSKLRATIDGL